MKFYVRYRIESENIPWVDDQGPVVEQYFQEYGQLQTWLLNNNHRRDLHVGGVGMKNLAAMKMGVPYQIKYNAPAMHLVLIGRECIKCAALIAEEFMNTRLEYDGCKAMI